MIQAIRKYIWIIASALILTLGVTTYVQYEKVNSLKTELSISKSNEKAFIAENNGLKEENIAIIDNMGVKGTYIKFLNKDILRLNE